MKKSSSFKTVDQDEEAEKWPGFAGFEVVPLNVADVGSRSRLVLGLGLGLTAEGFEREGKIGTGTFVELKVDEVVVDRLEVLLLGNGGVGIELASLDCLVSVSTSSKEGDNPINS